MHDVMLSYSLAAYKHRVVAAEEVFKGEGIVSRYPMWLQQYSSNVTQVGVRNYVLLLDLSCKALDAYLWCDMRLTEYSSSKNSRKLDP